MKEVILKVQNLEKSYEGKKVVDGVSFSVEKGDILGFLGPNGAGKSTTIRMITRMEQQDGGEIHFNGKKCDENAFWMKKEIGIVPQEIAIYQDMSAYDNVKFFCSLYGYRGSELEDRVTEALKFVGLLESKKERSSHFSGGMKRRLNIACAIAHSPKLLIMDEPTVGIDPQSRNCIMETIRTLKQRGTTVIYVSHYMEEIEALCNRVLLADHGKILEDMGKEELKEKYQTETIQSLEDIFLHLTGTKLRDEEV